MSRSLARSPDSHPSQTGSHPAAAADLISARRKLPLVESIVRDIVGTRRRLAILTAERDTLDSFRRELTWASRSRRYSVTEEAVTAESTVATAVEELSDLGVSLVDPDAGAVEFPTRINGQPAAFSWRLGEDEVRHWRIAGDATRRPIPDDWRTGGSARGRNQP
jgi:hypothetical protein